MLFPVDPLVQFCNNRVKIVIKHSKFMMLLFEIISFGFPRPLSECGGSLLLINMHENHSSTHSAHNDAFTRTEIEIDTHGYSSQ